MINADRGPNRGSGGSCPSRTLFKWISTVVHLSLMDTESDTTWLIISPNSNKIPSLLLQHEKVLQDPGLNFVVQLPRDTPPPLLIIKKCLRAAAHSEPPPTFAPRRMDGKWLENSFLLGSSYLVNHGGSVAYPMYVTSNYLLVTYFPTYLPIQRLQE